MLGSGHLEQEDEANGVHGLRDALQEAAAREHGELGLGAEQRRVHEKLGHVEHEHHERDHGEEGEAAAVLVRQDAGEERAAGAEYERVLRARLHVRLEAHEVPVGHGRPAVHGRVVRPLVALVVRLVVGRRSGSGFTCSLTHTIRCCCCCYLSTVVVVVVEPVDELVDVAVVVVDDVRRVERPEAHEASRLDQVLGLLELQVPERVVAVRVVHHVVGELDASSIDWRRIGHGRRVDAGQAYLAQHGAREVGRGRDEHVAVGDHAGHDGQEADEQELDLLVEAERADQVENVIEVVGERGAAVAAAAGAAALALRSRPGDVHLLRRCWWWRWRWRWR